jgi:protein PhnA
MSKGHEIHQQRMMALQAIGKDLARRAKSKCEITGKSGVPLFPYEVPPVPGETDLDRTLLICEECQRALDRPSTMEGGYHWQCLAEVVWSDFPTLQVVAWRLLGELAKREDWARIALEGVDLDPEVEVWANDSRP